MREFPTIEPRDQWDGSYSSTKNTVYVGHRMNGNDEELILALLNHELMHWFLEWFIDENASIKLDNCTYGLFPDEFLLNWDDKKTFRKMVLPFLKR